MNLTKIDECVRFSKEKLNHVREDRVAAIKQFVGVHYSENGSDKTVPTNLLELAVTTYLQLLAAHEPKCLVDTDDATLKPFAADLEIVINQLPREIRLTRTIRRAVLEAMFTIGIVKVGIAGCDPRPHIGDEPFVSLVQIDDYFCDMSAKSWDEIQYEGNDYWVSKDEIKKLFGIDLSGDDYAGLGDDGTVHARSVSNSESGGELSERVHLRDVYLYGEQPVMVTYAVETNTLIRSVPWDGPEGSPYVKLGFSEVPGNLMPLAPVQLWQDLHNLCNQVFRKLAQQAVASKKVAVFSGGNDSDVINFCQAQDGAAISGSGNDPREIAVGGIDQANLAFFLQNRDLFSLLAGNLDSLGGLSPQADTATQDRLINEAANARVKHMSNCVVEFTEAIFRRLAWYVWTDPVRERKYKKGSTRNFNIGVNKTWTPETRDGDFLDYNFSMDVFSMQDSSPSTRLQKLGNIFQTYIAPLLPSIEQSGFMLNPMKVMEYIGRNANMPELVGFFDSADSMPMQQSPRAAAGLPQPSYMSTKSPFTHRVYERVNRPGSMSERGKTAVLSAALLGNKSQPADMAGLGIGRAR